jgi:hypothetical protein
MVSCNGKMRMVGLLNLTTGTLFYLESWGAFVELVLIATRLHLFYHFKEGNIVFVAKEFLHQCLRLICHLPHHVSYHHVLVRVCWVREVNRSVYMSR